MATNQWNNSHSNSGESFESKLLKKTILENPEIFDKKDIEKMDEETVSVWKSEMREYRLNKLLQK